MNNAVFAIEPYQWNGIWVFDDPRVGLAQEPFVSRMPEIILCPALFRYFESAPAKLHAQVKPKPQSQT